MRYGTQFLTAFVVPAAFLMSPTVACASVLVHVIQTDPTANDASTVPSSTLPSADFLSPDINFNIVSSDNGTLNMFLNNPVFFNLQNGFDPTQNADNTFLEITGQTFLLSGANSFVVGHDDGIVLSFPEIGYTLSTPGPTGFSSTPINVNVANAGTYAFDLKYAECCGGPGNLVFNINGAPVGTPEPSTFLLSGLSLAALAGYSRLRRIRVE